MAAISKSFGATRALNGVSLELRAGEALALIGENGAGKSTLMNVLSGALAPDEGEMELEGRWYAPSGPHAARLAGVAMIYQELNLAPDLSVEENIMLGQESSYWGVLDRAEQRRRAGAALERLGHGNLRLEMPVSRLSVGMQQLVEIARALASEAKVVIFDEPTSSLARADVERLFDTIGRLRQEGLGVIYISHFLEEIRRVCDSYIVLRDGEAVDRGTLKGTSEAQIVSFMVGRTIAELYPRVPHTPGETVLSIAGLSGASKPRDASFELRRGEILGLAGLVGAGRTELVRSIYALDAVRSGRVRVGTIYPSATPKSRIRAGLAYVSEDRKSEGLAQARSIADNVTYSRLSPYSRGGWLNLKRRGQAVAGWMRALEIKSDTPEAAVESLSGGNQQKVALARVLHQGAEILLLDEPTRGIDVGTKAIIYRMMGELAAAGKAILFVSSYFQELLQVCDRIGVMSRGRLREIRPAVEWTEESLLSRAIETTE
ncbi:MAG TPA: sugar ABC transporter ATP-binding protein [Lacipirellulaceae bacterium]|nr:sugar ABC transporter ATP-binding protein [Lacipirellulaceae bacterium]